MISVRLRRLLLLVLLPVTATQAAPSFTITTLSFGADNSYADDINARGDVVGSRQQVNGYSELAPFVYAAGVLSDLSPANGFDEATAINDGGTIVGQIGFEASIYAGAGAWNPLNSGLTGEVTALNNSGIAAGNYYLDDLGVRHALKYSGGVGTDLGTLAGNSGYSLAEGINTAGVIVGSSDTADGAYHAVRFDLDGGITDLGSLDGAGGYSEGSDLNDAGQIVGNSANAAGDTRAFLWEAGTMFDLGTVDGFEYSEAKGINNLGQVVGFIADYDGSENSAFFYDGATMWDLATLVQGGLAAAGVSYFFDAVDINDSGQIVGNAFDLDGNRIGYVLTPTNVPEPGTWGALTGLALGAIVFLRRRGRR